jgi:hypothetical protein
MRNSPRCRIPEPKRDQAVDVHDRYGRTPPTGVRPQPQGRAEHRPGAREDTTRVTSRSALRAGPRSSVGRLGSRGPLVRG